MSWRGILFIALVLIGLYALMSYSGFFIHGDRRQDHASSETGVPARVSGELALGAQRRFQPYSAALMRQNGK